jgi:hypothetical protein
MNGRRAFVVAAVAFAAFGLSGCAGPDAADPGDPGGAPIVPGTPGGDPGVGSFSMQLTLGGGFRFDEVSYDVSGNGFHKTGTINVASSTEASVVVGGVPLGTGYTVQLTARDVDHKLLPCTGSATFDIQSAATVAVPVHLSCHEAPVVAPQAVPVPRWAALMVAALLLTFGLYAVPRRRRGA